MTPEVQEALAQVASGAEFKAPGSSRTACKIRGRDVIFCTSMENDPVQRKNRTGNFYETSDLYLLDSYVPKGAIFFDIGANVGNHSLYFAIMLGASKVVPIEPNPICWRLLIENIQVNGLLDRFDLTRLGVGIGDERAGGFGMEQRDRNIGAAALLPGQGAIEVWPGDDLLGDLRPDFVKIDVEGAELAALRGLRRLITRHRPMLFVEVADTNDAAFRDWCGQSGYRIELTRARYRRANNYFILPDD